MEGLGTLENRLYDAAVTGDTRTLHDLLEKDPLLLDRVSFTCPNKSPLHVATMRGHLAFVHEILNINPQLAEQLDFQQTSPLHVASTKGYLDIVKILISVAPDMCLSQDCRGRYPLHLAAIKGHVEVLAELVQRAPLVAREKLNRGETALHLCGKHHHLEALKILVQSLDGIIDARDDDGNTVLHIAVRDNQIEITQYLVENTDIDVRAQNSMGQSARDISERHTKNPELTKILDQRLYQTKNRQNRPEKWLTKKRDSIMVVAILIATMAFQAGVTPPGGVWQDDLTQDQQGNPVANPHRAGDAVMSYRSGRAFKSFMRCNTVAFVSSLSTILLLISGLPFKRRLFMWMLMMIMWLTVTSIAITYAIAITVVCPRRDREVVGDVTKLGIVVWCGVMTILLVGNTIRLIARWLKKTGVTMWPKRFRDLAANNNEGVAQKFQSDF